MTTTVANAVAEAIHTVLVGADIWISLHVGDPGENGANLADISSTGFVEYLSTDWTAPVDDAPTGGRLTDNDAGIDFGNATADEEFTHIGFWDGDVGVGSFLVGASLVESKPVTIGEPVTIPIGQLDVVGAGAP